MMNNKVLKQIDDIKAEISLYPRVAIALSGGIDSITLASIADLVATSSVEMFHAISPAVAPEASERVRDLSQRMGWKLTEINAGEFSDERYLQNPVNRCFYCKESLYSTIAAIAQKTSAHIFSGTNADDLAEYRPGLEAAAKFNVIHPFAQLGINKLLIRSMARELGLGDLANLPASPCLSSRIETGIPIVPATLALVHRIENRVYQSLKPAIVRCRLRATALVIELDQVSLTTLLAEEQSIFRIQLQGQIQDILDEAEISKEIRFSLYVTGSAFVGNKHAIA